MPLRRTFLIIAAAAAAVVPANPVFAAFGITSAIGAIELPGPPPPNLFPSSVEGALPIIFPEVLNGLTPLGGLDVDHDGSNVVANPTISGNVVHPLLIDTTIGPGTPVRFNSYMFHFDPVANPFFAFYVATINFDNPIIGVQLFSNGFVLDKPSGTPYTGTLEQGDFTIAANGGPPVAYYPGGLSFRGVEEDSFVLAIAGNQVMLGGSAQGFEIDQIRILTAAAVPEPLSAITWGIISVVCGFGLAGRWR
jgi:hypothetical protein